MIPAGFSRLSELGSASLASYSVTRTAVEWVAVIVAAKGGTVADITVGDCLELMEISDALFPSTGGKGPSFYQLLHEMGVFPPGAPVTVRMFNPNFQGQLTAEQLIDRYDLACRPVRDLLVDYLRERQPGIDYTTLRGLSTVLAGAFWKDLENHHPGIDSLRLSPDVAAAWRERLQTKESRTAEGTAAGAREPRMCSADYVIRVRSFYLDIAQWAADDPARWGPWAVPCPFRDAAATFRKEKNRRKSRMDQRTRERLPVLPALLAAVDQSRKAAAARLEAAAGRPARRAVHRRRGDAAAVTAVHAQQPDLGRGPGNRETPGPGTGRRQSVLGLGDRGDSPRHGHQDRGTDRAVAPQPGPVPAPVHRPAHPPAAHRPEQDRPGASPGHIPRAGGRPQHRPAPRPRPGRSRPPRGSLRPLRTSLDRRRCR